MKLVLKADVEKLGNAGDVVTVRDGFGRNFLIPQGKAIVATAGAIKMWEEKKRAAMQKQLQDVAFAKEMADKIEQTSITIAVQTGDEGKIHGSVTTSNIADALKDKGIAVDRRTISLDADVHALGEYTATVSLGNKVKAKLKVWVVKAA